MSIKSFYELKGSKCDDKEALEEMLPYVFDAVNWIVDELKSFSTRLSMLKDKDYKGPKPAKGEWYKAYQFVPPINWDAMPGMELGFMPISAELRGHKRAIHGETVFQKWDILTGKSEIISTKQLEDEGYDVEDFRYAVQADGKCAEDLGPYAATLDGEGANSMPLLCHPDMGWVFYLKGVNLYADKVIYPTISFRPEYLLCVNWITGDTYYIGAPPTEMQTNARGWWAKRDKTGLTLPEVWLHGLEVGSEEWERERKEMNGDTSMVIRYEEILAMQEFVKKAEKARQARMDACLKKFHAGGDEEAKGKEEFQAIYKEIESEAKAKGLPLVETCASPYDIIGDWYLLNFLEETYALPKGALMFRDVKRAKSRMHYSKPPCWMAWDMNMSCYWNLLHYTGNHFQEFLQTTSTSRWFLLNMLVSLRYGKSTMNAPNIPAWLGMNKKDFKNFIAEPDEKRFIVFLACNMFKPTSVVEFERIYEKTLELIESEMSEASEGKKFQIKNRRGKILFSTTDVPQVIQYYVDNKVYKSDSLYHFVKYMANEYALLKRTTDPVALRKMIEDVSSSVYSSKTPTLYDALEKKLLDYNRMARTVIPDNPFTMPHNIVKAHDNMVDNVNRIMRDRKECGVETDDLMTFARCYQGKNERCYTDGKYVVVEPESSIDLYDEGIALNHCIGTYGSLIAKKNGGMLIYFLRYASSPDKSLLTMQVDKDEDGVWTFTERTGEGNRVPNAAEIEFSDKWLEAFNADYAAQKKRASKDGPVIAFRPDIIEWFRMNGMSASSVPDYHPSMSEEINYSNFFDVAIPAAVGNAMETGVYTDEWCELFTRKLAQMCGSIRIKSLFKYGTEVMKKAVVAA